MKQVYDHQYVDGQIAATYVVLIVVAVIAHFACKRWCDKHEKMPEPKVAYTKQLVRSALRESGQPHRAKGAPARQEALNPTRRCSTGIFLDGLHCGGHQAAAHRTSAMLTNNASLVARPNA
ncbi:MAG: hypothetical protein EKK45_02530 [Curvibacter sp.]|jgi:hypothetical protein|uniref:hypothetical protein n=1 Tax=Curvibacter lanceolatus TaxID=86182 RepID=UPI000FB188B9|nr:hypothetical protein [Curvibacter lanceolatus]RUP34940.1 MAG: hypothetical protein EKK45_02530 [Curvibacter sp.]